MLGLEVEGVAELLLLLLEETREAWEMARQRWEETEQRSLTVEVRTEK